MQQQEIRSIKRMLREQKNLKGVEEDRATRIQKMQEQIQNKPNTKAKEIEACDELIAYCNKLKANFGLVPQSSEEVAKNMEK